MTVFKDKTLVITGAGDGIGRATALLAARRQAFVVLSDINLDGARETLRMMEEAGGRGAAYRLDVTDRDAVFDHAAMVEAEHGGTDILINNAGLAMMLEVSRMTADQLERIMAVNFFGVVNGCQAFLPQLQKAKGHIANISSIFGLVAIPTQSAYNASKFAVVGFTEALRMEMKEFSVRVSHIHPGGIATQIARRAVLPQEMDNAQSREDVQKDFSQFAHVTPEQAAATIIRGMEKNKLRILIGRDAIYVDILRRLLPARYERFLPFG